MLVAACFTGQPFCDLTFVLCLLVYLVKSMVPITFIDALLVTGIHPMTLSATFWYGALTSTWAPEWSPLSLTHSTAEINLFALIRCCFQFVPGQLFGCFCILFGTSEPACWPPLTEGGPTETFVALKQHPAKKRSKKTSTSDNFVL